MKRWMALFLILIITALAGAGICVFAESKAGEEDALVVTSFYPMYITALNLTEGVEGISLKNLASGHEGCLHDYQLTTENMRLLEDASLFIANGGGMEGFLMEVSRNFEGLEIISCDEGLDLGLASEEPAHSHDDEHGHGENAHYWMDPELYIRQVEYMAEKLSCWDSSHREQYEENKRIYCDKIRNITSTMDKELAFLKGTHAISFHEAFYYLAEHLNVNIDYTLDLDGDVYLGAKEVADIIEKTEEGKTGALWAEKSLNQDFLSLILKEGPVKAVRLNVFTGGEADKDAYIKGMEENIEALKGLAE